MRHHATDTSSLDTGCTPTSRLTFSPTGAAPGGLGGAGRLELELDAQHAVAVRLQRHPSHDGRRAWLLTDAVGAAQSPGAHYRAETQPDSLSRQVTEGRSLETIIIIL